MTIQPIVIPPLIQALGFTSAIMLSAGLGFGLALRSAPLAQSGLTPPGATSPLRSDQTFPPRPGWNLESGAEDENPGKARYNSLQTP